MSTASSLLEVHQPVRSVSLPTSLSLNLTIEDELTKFRTSEASSRSLCTDNLHQRLVSLAYLYVSMEELLESPSTQQAFLCRKQGKLLVEEALDMSFPLLDTCSAIKDLMLQLKEQVQILQSALRRRKGSSLRCIEEIIFAYTSFRKKAKKDIAKCLRSLKQTENKCACQGPVLSDVDHDLVLQIARALRELYEITISIFRSLLISLSMPAASKTKASGWSLISKLVRTSSVDSTRGRNIAVNEVGDVDIGLHLLLEDRADVQQIQGMLWKLEAGVQCLETALDGLFRHLVRSRVSLLNILTC